MIAVCSFRCSAISSPKTALQFLRRITFTGAARELPWQSWIIVLLCSNRNWEYIICWQMHYDNSFVAYFPSNLPRCLLHFENSDLGLKPSLLLSGKIEIAGILHRLKGEDCIIKGMQFQFILYGIKCCRTGESGLHGPQWLRSWPRNNELHL